MSERSEFTGGRATAREPDVDGVRGAAPGDVSERSEFTGAVEPLGRAVETELALDMLKHAVPFAPVVVLLSWLVWGSRGAWSALLAVAVVVVNLLLSSISLAWAARVSPTALMGAALGGFLVRMMLVTAVVIAVKGSAWVDLTALGRRHPRDPPLLARLGDPVRGRQPRLSRSQASERRVMPSILALEFPPISHAVEWPIIFGGDWLGVNKVVLLMWASVIVVFGFFMIAVRTQRLVPVGVQNVAESTVDFVRNGIILQTMGEDGLFYTPFLLMMFSFIFVCNIWEVIPIAQMPVNARIALPLFMALLVYVMYHVVGIKRQGFGGYVKSSLIPPGVPKVDPAAADVHRADHAAHHQAAVAVRPAVRQHVRRPPAADHLRHHLLGPLGGAVADHHPAVLRLPA